jgi:hypothetical protein
VVPVDTPVVPVEAAAVVPVEAAAVDPVEAAAVDPVEAAAEEPVEAAAVEPVEAAAVEPVEAAAVEPVEAAAVEPVEAAAVEPVEAAAVEPVAPWLPVEPAVVPVDPVPWLPLLWLPLLPELPRVLAEEPLLELVVMLDPLHAVSNRNGRINLRLRMKRSHSPKGRMQWLILRDGGASVPGIGVGAVRAAGAAWRAVGGEFLEELKGHSRPVKQRVLRASSADPGRSVAGSGQPMQLDCRPIRKSVNLCLGIHESERPELCRPESTCRPRPSAADMGLRRESLHAFSRRRGARARSARPRAAPRPPAPCPGVPRRRAGPPPAQVQSPSRGW